MRCAWLGAARAACAALNVSAVAQSVLLTQRLERSAAVRQQPHLREQKVAQVARAQRFAKLYLVLGMLAGVLGLVLFVFLVNESG
eukprot:COSAG04_NODE_2495_length_4011_cov_2.445041_3_plen_85_part_00